jgi:hypothetical protein
MLDRLFDLPVEIPSIGHDDHRVKDLRTVFLNVDKLVPSPCNRIAFAAAR